MAPFIAVTANHRLNFIHIHPLRNTRPVKKMTDDPFVCKVGEDLAEGLNGQKVLLVVLMAVMVSQTPGINTDSFIQLIADAKKPIISIYFQPYASACVPT